jgi:NAD(P)-dependent dehydrogenase (short-subunit alcohol dehydrogenase family)
VTGAARGIGQAVAERLAADGVEVLMPSRAELDLACPESISSYAASLPEVDILVNNAGINPLAEIDEITWENWQQTLQVNLSAPFRLLQEIAPRMKARGWGRVVNVSSVFGVVAKARRGAYSAAKSGLNGLTRVAAIELGPHGILVNSICPGYVETELTRQNNSADALAEIAAGIPLRRLAQPAELAAAVAFLCSESNSYLTGQTLIVDGGFTCV